MRNGFLLATIVAAFALFAPPAHADLKIAAPPTTGGQLAVPYTYSGPAGLLRLELRAPGAATFKSYGIWPASASGTLFTFMYAWPVFGVVEGDWAVRVVASYGGDDVLEVAEGTTRLDWVGDFGVSAPIFDPIELGVTSGEKQLRVENTLGGPLRVKRVYAPPGSELAVTSDGCAGVTLYVVEGCYVGVTFTPATVGRHRATLLIDANAVKNEIYMLGTGLEHPPPDPVPTVAPLPTPTPTPAPPVAPDREPELAFDSSPGRTSTRLYRLRLENVKPGSTVTVRCAKGCPTKSFTKRGASGTVSLSRFASRALKPGTTIKVALASPGRPARSATIKIRARRAPSVSGSL